MKKGEKTRRAILDRALDLASELGLEGLTIGRLADDLRLSKSGLFAHFRSKDALQLATLEHAASKFADTVLRPALKKPRGEARLRALLELWLKWSALNSLRGGCLFASAATEFDDRPGAVRDRLVVLQRQWLDVIARSARGAIEEGHFRKDVDPEQFAHDLYAVVLGYFHAARLLRDPKAKRRTFAAFDTLIRGSRAA